MVPRAVVLSCLALLPLAMVLVQGNANPRRHINEWSRERLAEKFYRGNLRALSSLLEQPQMPERYLTGRESFYANLKARNRVLGFSWSNCGSDSDPVQIRNLDLSPDPVQVPGNIELTFDVVFNTNVTSPFEVDMDIKKKVAFIWVDVPCMDNVGSCSYGDVCPMMHDTCPPAFQEHGIPCTCPFPQGEYSLPQTTLPIPDLHVPSFLTTGDYKVTINGKDGGSRLFCLHLELSMD